MTKVLYVEDNDDNVYMLKMRLELLGDFEVLTAEDGQRGCEMAATERPDIILMDLQMPVMGGYEATAEIRRIGAGQRRVPIVALTANAMSETQEECLQAGMDGYVTKPINRAELMKTIEGLTRL